MRNRSTWFRVAVALAAVVVARPALAQETATPLIISAQRSMVTRAELKAALEELDRMLASSGYSEALRNAKRSEADAIRDRLAEGDIRTGDVVQIAVTGDASFNNLYRVTTLRTITLPGGTEISMKGVLRSEVQEHVTNEMKKMLRDPSVSATPFIRVSLFGAIGKPGFYNAPATALLSETLMALGGGVANNANLKKSRIMRGEKIVIDGTEFQDAIDRGKTLDQLNLQAGDVINVAEKPTGGVFVKVLGVVSAVSSLVWLGVQIF